jgi:hypothetical protein
VTKILLAAAESLVAIHFVTMTQELTATKRLAFLVMIGLESAWQITGQGSAWLMAIVESQEVSLPVTVTTEWWAWSQQLNFARQLKVWMAAWKRRG